MRFFERFILFLLVIIVGALAGLSALGNLGTHESYAGGGIVILILLVLYYLQRKVDSWLSVIITQSNYLQEDAFTSQYDRSPVPYLAITKDGKVKKGNPAAVHLLETEVNSINKINFFDLISSESDINSSVFAGKIEAGHTINDLEIQLNTANGKNIWVLFSIHKYRGEEERLVSLVDITEQKQIDTAKSEFVALATHQLRTPISAIRWNVELLQKNLRDTKTEKQARYLTKIDRNVFRMIALINDFLSVSKLEMGTFAATEENVNLSDFYSSILDEFVEKITEKKINVDRKDIPPQLVIKTDSRLFHIIVSNLVSNAVKYLQTNGTLLFTYELKGQMLEMVVADNGIGVPESEVDKLFTKFYRASNAQSHQTEGTGLGLYIVKQSVEQLGGTIRVNSAENKGARFTVSIPAKVVSAKEIG